MRKSIKLYEINTALHKGFILCIRLFIMEAFVVIENVRHRRCTLTPFTVARWHGIFWDTPKWEPNKRGRVVEWQVIACNTESRCPLFPAVRFPHFIESLFWFRSIPSLELWVLSLILKSFIVSYFWQKLHWAPNAESEIWLESSLCFSL